MLQDGLDETLSLEVLDGTAGERTGDAELVADGGDGDGLLGRDLLEKLVISLLVKERGVVGLFLGLSLGPLLLLRKAKSTNIREGKKKEKREVEGKAKNEKRRRKGEGGKAMQKRRRKGKAKEEERLSSVFLGCKKGEKKKCEEKDEKREGEEGSRERG